MEHTWLIGSGGYIYTYVHEHSYLHIYISLSLHLHTSVPLSLSLCTYSTNATCVALCCLPHKTFMCTYIHPPPLHTHIDIQHKSDVALKPCYESNTILMHTHTKPPTPPHTSRYSTQRQKQRAWRWNRAVCLTKTLRRILVGHGSSAVTSSRYVCVCVCVYGCLCVYVCALLLNLPKQSGHLCSVCCLWMRWWVRELIGSWVRWWGSWVR